MTRHIGHDTIRWGYIFSEVFFLYIRLFGIFIAYYFTKIYVAKNRSSANPRRAEKLWRYTACIAVVALIAVFAAANISGDPDDPDEGHAVEGLNYNRGLIVFFALIVATLFGVADGFRISDKDIPRGSSRDDDW